MNRIRYVRGLLLLFITFCSYIGEATIIYDKVSEIPNEDRETLSRLFDYLVFEHAFAYALFGSKPISRTGTIRQLVEEIRQDDPDHPFVHLEEWWGVWQKYAHLFPMNEYALFSQEYKGCFEIYFVNKRECKKLIEENLALFQEKIGKKLTVEQIFTNMISTGNLFEEGLGASQTLYGMAFGFGRKNAQGFEDFHFKGKRDLIKEQRIFPLADNKKGGLMLPPFASFSKRETAKLVKKYRKERDKILEIYSKGDFLEITLSQLVKQGD